MSCYPLPAFMSCHVMSLPCHCCVMWCRVMSCHVTLSLVTPVVCTSCKCFHLSFCVLSCLHMAICIINCHKPSALRQSTCAACRGKVRLIEKGFEGVHRPMKSLCLFCLTASHQDTTLGTASQAYLMSRSGCKDDCTISLLHCMNLHCFC